MINDICDCGYINETNDYAKSIGHTFYTKLIETNGNIVKCVIQFDGSKKEVRKYTIDANDKVKYLSFSVDEIRGISETMMKNGWL